MSAAAPGPGATRRRFEIVRDEDDPTGTLVIGIREIPPVDAVAMETLPLDLLADAPFPDGPATCRRCGHEFKSYRIRTIEEQKQLVDLDGNLVYELELVCRFCDTVYPWHTSWRGMQEHTRAFKKLLATMQRMHESQAQLDAEMQKEDPR